jgi:hypothetical protein
MLVSVIGAFWSLKKAKTLYGSAIGPRHIQFVSVCLIVPTILILGLEKVLTSETTATLIGGLAGYLLSNLGKYEPPTPDSGQGGNGNANKRSQSAGGGERKDSLQADSTDRSADNALQPDPLDQKPDAHGESAQDKIERMKKKYPPQNPFEHKTGD